MCGDWFVLAGKEHETSGYLEKISYKYNLYTSKHFRKANKGNKGISFGKVVFTTTVELHRPDAFLSPIYYTSPTSSLCTQLISANAGTAGLLTCESAKAIDWQLWGLSVSNEAEKIGGNDVKKI